MFTIRPLQATDFVEWAHYCNTLAPEEPPVTAEILQEQETLAVAERSTGVVIALTEETIIATVRYGEARSKEDGPGVYWLYFSALPTYRTGELFDELYQGVSTVLTTKAATRVQGMAREDDAMMVEFYQRHHFDEKLRSFGANLALAPFDPTAYADCETRLHQAGVEIKTYAELVNDPQRDRKLYELLEETSHELPNVSQFDRQSFTEFVTDHLQNPALLPDAYFIAVQGENYVGVSELFRGDEPGAFDTQNSSVRRTHRRLGIALALKVRLNLCEDAWRDTGDNRHGGHKLAHHHPKSAPRFCARANVDYVCPTTISRLSNP